MAKTTKRTINDALRAAGLRVAEWSKSGRIKGMSNVTSASFEAKPEEDWRILWEAPRYRGRNHEAYTVKGYNLRYWPGRWETAEDVDKAMAAGVNALMAKGLSAEIRARGTERVIWVEVPEAEREEKRRLA